MKGNAPSRDAARLKTEASSVMESSPVLRGRPFTLACSSNTTGTRSTAYNIRSITIFVAQCLQQAQVKDICG